MPSVVAIPLTQIQNDLMRARHCILYLRLEDLQSNYGQRGVLYKMNAHDVMQ